MLGNVRARHNELLGIEKAMSEILTLVQDLDTVVIQQEAPVIAAEEQTNQAVVHMEEANKQVDKAADHARRRRKLKWICAAIVLLILIAIGVGVGVGVTVSNNATKTATGSQ